jgi:hypothetical protein
MTDRSMKGAAVAAFFLVSLVANVHAMVYLIANPVRPTTYYVDSDLGDDASDGKSPGSAWRTVSKVNEQLFHSGDSVLFARGGTWRERLRIQSSLTGQCPITFGAYGSGEKPRLLGSVQKNRQEDWTLAAPDTWATAANSFPADVGFMLLGGEDGNNTGMKCERLDQVDVAREFWYDANGKRVYVHCVNNPAVAYGSIEIARSIDRHDHVITGTSVACIRIEQLAIKYFNSHGIAFSSSQGVTIRDCDISFGGGQYQFDGQTVRFGNGIEFWEGTRDTLVERCKIWEVYDAAVTNQGNNANEQRNITYSKNIIWNCEYSFEYWNLPNASATVAIAFTGNVCLKAGSGWSHSQRPDPSGRELCFFKNRASITDFQVTNNSFIEAVGNVLYLHNVWNGLDALVLDNNSFYQRTGTMISYTGHTYAMGQFTQYQADSGKDASSISQDLDAVKDHSRALVDPPDLPLLESILATIT